ncbi:MAG: transcription termination factor Rho [Actinobacteria bacterium]|nr:transcription termination factor Rho [Actinomycetota bacterium]
MHVAAEHKGHHHVSVDSIDVDGLERKDRAELATIAEALGGKPTSRTRKADIIGMILDLAGVTTAGADDPRGGANPPPAPAREGRNGASSTTGESGVEAATTADAGSGDAGAAEDGDATSTDASTTGADVEAPSAKVAPADGSDQPEDQRSRPQGDQSQTQKGNQGQGQRSGQNQGGQGRNQGNQNQGNQNQGNQNQGNQGGGGQQGEPEAGNRRRRRRRGRDRERQGEDVVQQPNEQWDGEPVDVAGFLDLRDEGYGFLRVKGFLPSRDDVYVSVKQTRQLGLRRGDFLEGASRPAGRAEKNPALLRIDKVNGGDPEKARERPRFEDLTPLFPDERLRLERADLPGDMTSRIVDLIAPIGKGQRGLIVSPPKAGKTTVMKTVAQSIEHNNPEVHLMVLLVDERPEEVTDMRRSVRGDVIASTFDRPSDEHTQVAELASERAKRMVEMGKDVVIILDGITRLARAYNLAAPATGRIMSGGIDTGALYPPKKFFGAARNVEEGGSLTILATALVETGSKMDEVIFEEFKGTGNMELRLDRKAAEKRIYPAIDVDASSTRHEELLFERTQLQQVWKLRRVLSGLAADGNTGAGLELLIDRMRTFPSNDVFLAEIAKAPGVPG